MFQKLSDILIPFHQAIQEGGTTYLDMERREGAATLALALRATQVMEQPAWVNIGALALSQERLTVHRLDVQSIVQVQGSFVDTLPSDPPRLMQSGWLIESASLTVPLFDDYVSIGGYSIGGQSWVVGLRYPDGITVGQFRPRWGDQDVEGAFYQTLDLFIDDVVGHREDTIKMVIFALTLGALLEAEGTPLTTRSVRQEAGATRRKYGKPKKPLVWSVSQVGLKPQPVSEKEATEPTESSDMSGRHAEKVRVRGFLRRQPFGPARTERKWVYVASFESTRYKGDNPKRFDV